MRYFKCDDEMWRFPATGPPQIRTAARLRWVEGAVMNLAEFLLVNPDAEEVTAGEAEGFAEAASHGSERVTGRERR